MPAASTTIASDILPARLPAKFLPRSILDPICVRVSRGPPSVLARLNVPMVVKSYAICLAALAEMIDATNLISPDLIDLVMQPMNTSACRTCMLTLLRARDGRREGSRKGRVGIKRS